MFGAAWNDPEQVAAVRESEQVASVESQRSRASIRYLTPTAYSPAGRSNEKWGVEIDRPLRETFSKTASGVVRDKTRLLTSLPAGIGTTAEQPLDIQIRRPASTRLFMELPVLSDDAFVAS
jgi:hypothetical protein